MFTVMRLSTVVTCCLVSLFFVGWVLAQEEEKGEGAAKRPGGEIAQLIRAKDFGPAAEKLEQALTETPMDPSLLALRQQLGMALAGANKYPEAIEQLTKLYDHQLANIDQPGTANRLASSLNMINSIYRRAGRGDEVMAIVDRALEAAKEKLKTDEFSPAVVGMSALLRAKAAALQASGDRNAARELLIADLDANRKMLDASGGKPEIAAHVLGLMATTLSFREAEQREAAFGEFDTLAQATLKENPNAVPVVSAYIAGITSYASSISRDKPDEAEKIVESGLAAVNAAKEANPDMEQQLTAMAKGFDRLKSQIAAARKLLALIGQPAPSLDSAAWVNGPELSFESLKGKVVLLDFWAVWCGPCIATFPHLKHLHDAYSPDGLQIVGITRQYNYKWDDAAEKAVSAEGEVELADELKMLEKFIASHELKHPSLVTPKESKMQQEYGVTGIPQVVLIDKQGNVRMIKVGSGEENARQIEDMIKQLLAEKY